MALAARSRVAGICAALADCVWCPRNVPKNFSILEAMNRRRDPIEARPMNDPVNHHYLPVFYLRNWCDGAGKVVRYYRPYQEVVASPIAPENTGFEPHLYALDGYPDDQKQWIEKYFMGPVVDDPAARALQILLAANGAGLTAEPRIAWARFLMSLSLRDPDAVAKIGVDVRDELFARLSHYGDLYDANRTANDPQTVVEWAKKHMPLVLDNVGKLHLPDFIDNSGVGDVLVQMRWFTFDLASGGVTLLTGDRPFIRTYGLKDRRCIVILPLSPRHVFVATNSRETDRGLQRAKPEHLARDINARIVAQAKKHVYGTSNHHKRFVENRLAPLAPRNRK
jgi:hypothetical protein